MSMTRSLASACLISSVIMSPSPRHACLKDRVVQHQDGADDALLTRLRAAFREIADPARAPGMQAYMKSSMPYHGASATAMRTVCKCVFAHLELRSAAAWRRQVLAIWRQAHYREERYAAIELTGLRRADRFQTPDALPMYAE